MSYAFQDGLMGMQPVNVNDTVQRHPLGQIAHAVDPVLGGGEFIYLKVGGVAVGIGNLVTYNVNAGTTTMTPNGALTGILGAPVGVSMAAGQPSTYGWFQISGQAVVGKDGSAPAANGVPFLAAAVGVITATQAAGRELLNAAFATAALAGATTVNLTLSRPFIEGQIT